MAQVHDLTIGNIFQHTIIGIAQTGHATNMVTRWQLTALTTAQAYPSGILAVAQSLNAALQVLYKACLPADWTITGSLTARIAESETAYPPIRSRGLRLTLTGPGTYPSGVTKAANIAASIQRFSFKSGRTEQGEMHIGPIADTAYLLGVLQAPILTALNALAGQLVASVNLIGPTGTLGPVAWRQGTKAVPHQPFLSQYFGYIVPTFISSERKRKIDPITGN